MPSISRSEMADEYGLTLSFLNSNKEIRAIFNKAVAQTWDPARFQAAVRNTNWYKKTSEPWRQAQVLKKTDPATYEQRLSQVRARLTLMSAEYGAKMSAGTFDRFANQVFAQGWDDNQVRQHLAGYIQYRDGRLLGQAGQWEQEIRQHMRDMGVMWTDKTIQHSVRRMVQGNLTVQDIISQVNESAKGKYQHLADRITQGETLYDIASPFIQQIGQVLEINPESLSVDDPLIQKAMDYVPNGDKPGTHRTMTLSEFGNTLRRDPRWKATDNAKSTASTVLRSLGEAFGKSV
jgi:YesN/AraC family two-component response regulator